MCIRDRHNANVWLVNTGWVGGRFGVGKRISIRHTRNLLNAALEGKLEKVKFRKDKLFGFEVPLTCPEVPEDVLEPSNSWGNKDEYWKKYDALAACLLYTSPSPRDRTRSRMPSSA